MLPSILAKQLKQGLVDNFKAIFPMSTSAFENSITSFLETNGSVFLDPYISINLPFRHATQKNEIMFESEVSRYEPYEHQVEAYKRILTNDRSTLIATGTG
ncbi:MAG: hypothetical protein LBU04_05845 [Christensenellaceae bacterium]|jgi:DEAD/DEAH box helicase domain-containing protein|nr:hypothetical protein [Christensenellaceae bacterium]